MPSTINSSTCLASLRPFDLEERTRQRGRLERANIGGRARAVEHEATQLGRRLTHLPTRLNGPTVSFRPHNLGAADFWPVVIGAPEFLPSPRAV
jgi:hypothetical protein